MDHKNFGKIVKSLRKEHIHYHTGRFWTQKDLAERAHLSAKMVENIEQGRRTNLDGNDLRSLADALKLSTLERREFFAAASELGQVDENGKDEHGENAAEIFSNRVWNQFSAIQMPGYVTDSLSNIIGINEPMMHFHGISHEILEKACQTDIGCNMLSIFFRPNSPLKAAMSNRWHELAQSHIYQFQFTALRYRYVSRFEKILLQMHHYPEFTQIWQQSRYNAVDTNSMIRVYQYVHVRYGDVHYATTVTPIWTPYGSVYFTVFIPCDTHTNVVFSDLGQHRVNARRVMMWPEMTFEAGA